MANYASLISSIQSVIRTNGQNAITGALLQSSLISMVNSLGSGYQFAGIAIPTTNPGTPDQRVFYIASQVGTYPNFGGVSITGLSVLYYDGSWHLSALNVPVSFNNSDNVYKVLFDKVYMSNSFISPSGNISSDSSRSALNYLPCYPGATIQYRGESDNQYVLAIAFYDENKTFISGISNVGSRELRTTTAPNNAYYVRMTTLTDEIDQCAYYCHGLLEYIQNQFLSLVVETTGQPQYETTNYALFTDIYTNKIINNNGGIEVDPISQRNCTSYVLLDRDHDLYIGTNGNAEAHFMGANGEYMSYLNGYIDSPISKSNFPSGAKYVAFVYYRSTIPAIGFYAGTRDTRFCPKVVPTIFKKKNTRPVVNILASDTQVEIFEKLMNAWYTRDCDVYFEIGNYTFDTIFDVMKNTYGWGTAYEMPIGGNCRYYLNGATITGTMVSTDTDVRQNSSVFGTHRNSVNDCSFELIGGKIVANGVVYGVHDEFDGNTIPCTHTYKNLTIQYITGQYTDVSIAKCIGGGLGQYAYINIENCIFLNDNVNQDAVSYHGAYDLLSMNCHADIRLINCWLDTRFGAHTLYSATQSATLLISGCSLKAIPSMQYWTIYDVNNKIRN